MSSRTAIRKRTEFGAVYTPPVLADWVAEEALQLVPPNTRILAFDPACGDGELLLAVKRQASRAVVAGIDLDSDAVQSAQARCGARARIVRGNALLPGRSRSLAEHWKELLGGRKPSVYILNPPWGVSLREKREIFIGLGLTLATGQFDSFELFCEAAVRFADHGGVLAFILPDAIFYPEKRNFRRFLLSNCEICLVARLGEGFFPGVFRAASVVVAVKRSPRKEHRTRCLRLKPQDRRDLNAGEKTLTAICDSESHTILQSRFMLDPDARFDLDLRCEEESTVSKFKVFEPNWSDWLKTARGVEISKTGRVAVCPACKCANPFPRNGQDTLCKHCDKPFFAAGENVRTIIHKCVRRPANCRRIIVGEDVDRYNVKSAHYIVTNVPGVDYKDSVHRATPRLLVRKTGLGIKAALDGSTDYTNQVVFMYYRANSSVPDFFLYYVLGVLCSRVTLSYFLRTHGEVEWKSHPYVTQKILNDIPIPIFTQGSQTERQAMAIADAVRFFCQSPGKDLAHDVFIDCLVAGLYDLTFAECRWVVDVLDQADSLEPIRSVRLDGYELLQPHFVK